jgi:hypothetical protein
MVASSVFDYSILSTAHYKRKAEGGCAPDSGEYLCKPWPQGYRSPFPGYYDTWHSQFSETANLANSLKGWPGWPCRVLDRSTCCCVNPLRQKPRLPTALGLGNLA